ATASPSTGKWSVIMRDVIGTATTTYPFATMVAAAGVSNYQGLTVHIRAGLDDRVGSEAMTTIYAKNSSVESPSNTVNAGGQSTYPICAGSGYRSCCVCTTCAPHFGAATAAAQTRARHC